DTLLVSDLFYSEDYLLSFTPNPNIVVKYYFKTKKLFLQPKPNFEGVTLLEFKLKGEKYHIPIFSRIKQKHVFKFQPQSKPENRMNIMGTFNDWNRNSLPMQDEDGDGKYEIVLELDPGQYLYQFVVDQAEIWDPENPLKVDNGFGSFNSVVFIPPRHKEKTFLHVMGYETSPEKTILKFLYEKENQTEPLTEEHVFGLIDNLQLQKEQLKIFGNRIEVILHSENLAGTKTLRLLVTQNGQVTNMQSVQLHNGKPPGPQHDIVTWHDAIIYAIMIDRFFDGDSSNSHPVIHDSLAPKVNYMGGDLQGIIDKLAEGYFDSLGVNTLWLSPVNQNTNEAFKEWPPPHRYVSAYHGYWPTHPEKVEERFGDLNLLKKLVKYAHERGIKILLDFIANHVHQDHPFFQEHRDWFGTLELPDGRKNIRFWDEFRLTTWFEPYLPSFDYLGSNAALEAMTDNAIWWLKETEADGFRHDAVKHIPNRFWRVLTKKIKREIEIPAKHNI
ncbi:MAG: alpha-amylase family glycosyl hydrolase, partial [bacterium]